MNCSLRHLGNDTKHLSYRPASICANFSFNFLKVFRDQWWTTAPLFVVNISPSFGEFTAPIRYILPIHNVTINSKNWFVNFRWTFNFALKNRMMERTSHLAGLWIGAAISNTSHSNKAGFTTVKRARLKGKGSSSTAVATKRIKNFPIGLNVMYIYFPDTPRTSGHLKCGGYWWSRNISRANNLFPQKLRLYKFLFQV